MTLENKEKINRLGIFFFYDKDGIVDHYIPYLLKNIIPFFKETLVVCNGMLSGEGRTTFENLGCKVFVRKNEGFDVWAYKDAMSLYGWDKLAQYDELILFNHTIYGPLYPFSEMFEKMDKMDIDFWGITAHNGAKCDPWGKTGRGYLPMHIQSHFIAIRQKLLNSLEFHAYWDNMRPVKSYIDAISYHEAIFTETFSNYGYRYSIYIDTTNLSKVSTYPLLMMAADLVKNYRCPIIKRRSFFTDMPIYLNETCNEQAYELFEYIKSSTNYDVNLIWTNLLRTCNLYDLKNCLSLNYILPSNIKYESNTNNGTPKVALILHIYLTDLAAYCYQYALSMPSYADIYITTDSEEKKQKIYDVFKDIKCNKLTIFVIENKGRDVGALLVGCKNILPQYDYVCFAHDKSPRNVKPATVGMSFSYSCYEGVLKNKDYVNNIIKTFEDNPKLGLLAPPPPNHADYYLTLGHEWTVNYKITLELAKKLGINVDIAKDKPPISPLGTIFWFRPQALKPLTDYNWKYSDFPSEPIKIDGTILHAVERIYSFSAQHSGFYSAWVMPDSYASIYITNIYYYLRCINTTFFPNEANFQKLVLSDIDSHRNSLRYEDIFRIPVARKYRILMGLRLLMPIRLYNFLRAIKRRLVK